MKNVLFYIFRCLLFIFRILCLMLWLKWFQSVLSLWFSLVTFRSVWEGVGNVLGFGLAVWLYYVLIRGSAKIVRYLGSSIYGGNYFTVGRDIICVCKVSKHAKFVISGVYRFISSFFVWGL